MAGKASGLFRIPEILAQLRQVDIPVVDRAVIEQLFVLKRRRAIELLHQFGGYQAGRTFLIDRQRLIRFLERLEQGDDFTFEIGRREHLSAGLDALRRHHVGATVRIPVEPEVFNARMRQLNEGVRIASGQLIIQFSSKEDLLAKLFELAQAAANDYETFESMTRPV